MAMISINGEEHFYDDYLVSNLDLLKKKVEKNWDGIIYIGGFEGDGKSTLAAQIAMYLDPTYSIDRCTFTPEQFIDAVDNTNDHYKAIVWDEAQDAVDSGASRDPIARTVKSKLTRIRRKRLFIIICAPDYWRINRYLFIQRSIAFLLVYAEGLERGRFNFYSRPKKHLLYVKGKKEENHLVVMPDFRGNFNGWFPLDEDSYDTKKELAEKMIKVEKQDERMLKEYEKGVRFGMVKMFGSLIRNRWLKRGAEKFAASVVKLSPGRLRGLVAELWENGELRDNSESDESDQAHVSDDRTGEEFL